MSTLHIPQVGPDDVPRGRWFLTGAGGFIGRHLMRRLVDAGQPVVALARAGSPIPAPAGHEGAHPLVTVVRGDIEQPLLGGALDGQATDFAVHLAAHVGDWGPTAAFEAANVRGTENALRAAARAGAKVIVHTSSIAAMGFTPGENAGRDRLPVTEGVDDYSRTKAEGENVARRLAAEGLPIVIARPGDVYGVGSEPWVERPLRMIKSHQMILVDAGRGHFGHVWVDNLIDGILLAVHTPAAIGRTYVFTDAEQHTTMGTYFGRLAEIAGRKGPMVGLPKSVAFGLATACEGAARVFGFTPPFTRAAVRFVTKRGSYSIAEAQTELGYAPRVSFEDGIAMLTKHYGKG